MAGVGGGGGEEADEVVQNFPPFARIYKSGRVERLKGESVVPASCTAGGGGGDEQDLPSKGVASKDVAVSADVSARLFLPAETAKVKLPVLLYVHGGGFVIETPFSPTYHDYVASLAAAAGVLAVSVHYRRAPEHPLPAAYDDSWAALRWIASHAAGAGPDPWLSHRADCRRVFLAGDSAGGNIVHDLMLRTGAEAVPPPVPTVVGAVLVHPYFWGAHETEKVVDPAVWAGMEKFWRFVCPGTTGKDDPLTNPIAGAGPGRLARLAGKRVLVCLAEKDMLTVWGRMYYEALGSSGYKGTVEILETHGEGHVFHLFNPDCQNAKEMMKTVVDFINRDDD